MLGALSRSDLDDASRAPTFYLGTYTREGRKRDQQPCFPSCLEGAAAPMSKKRASSKEGGGGGKMVCHCEPSI